MPACAARVDLRAYLVLAVTVVVHRGPHPGHALLPAAPPQQGVLLAARAPQEHAQYARARAVHVVVEHQALGGMGPPQPGGEQARRVARTHQGRLDVHEVPWRPTRTG